MEDRLAKLELDMIALRAVTTNLWSNFIANGTPNPVETARRLSHEQREDIGSMLRNPAADAGPHVEETIHEIQDRLESFWQGVEDLLSRR
ncbi:hypothetical protein U1701_13235 [Sphingomonas sp. PB2P19]|uniref:hypothetical protein n=1 Tax=Sphingomonas rhamnosi TaxID=3096156 RepID=UPI002FCA14EC